MEMRFHTPRKVPGSSMKNNPASTYARNMRESRRSQANASIGGSSRCDTCGGGLSTVVMRHSHSVDSLPNATRAGTERCFQDERADAGRAQILAMQRRERGTWDTHSPEACIRR